MKEIEEIVNQEIRKELNDYIQKYGEDKLHKFFNNFYGNLPFGWRREGSEDINNQKVDDPRASQKLQNMTWTEFYQDIDNTISELNIDMNELTKLYRARDLKTLAKATLPIYIKLVEKGYKSYPDLTS